MGGAPQASFTLERTSEGFDVRGQVPASSAQSHPVLEKIRPKAPREMRFRVRYRRRNFQAAATPIRMESCDLHLRGRFEEYGHICIECPDGQQIVIAMRPPPRK